MTQNKDYYRIYMDEIVEYFNGVKPRTAERKCIKAGISIIAEGKSKYAVREEFLLLINKQAEEEMRKKYGQDWKKGMDDYYDSGEELKINNPKHSFRTYIPKTQQTEQFAQKWKHI